MSRRRLLALGLPWVLLLPGPAWGDPPAAEDDREAEMFGEDEAAPVAGPAANGGGSGGASSSRSAGSGSSGGSGSNGAEDFGDDRMAPIELERADKDRLQIGGLLYLRNGLSWNEVDPWSRQPLTISNLTDIYLDARPSDRVRGFVRGRLLWTPTIGDSNSAGLLGFTTGSSELSPQLVELWLKFDVARSVFLTIGAQQVRFGATRLWNPVDVIYAQRRSPLTLFDQRTGLPMLKVHVPIDALGWNAYALAIADGAQQLRDFSLVGRLEMVVSTVEVGLLAKKRMGEDPRFGLDVSAGVWEFDVGVEVGARRDAGGTWHWMSSAKLEHTVRLNDEDNLIWGLEGFYNPDGAASLETALDRIEGALQTSMTTGVSAGLPFQPFYVGRWYAAIFAVLMSPGSWNDTNFTMSALSNFSDGSGTIRFDVSQTLHQHVRIEAYTGLNLGSDGEFRFYTQGLKDRFGPLLQAAGQDPDALFKRPVAQFGVNLRISL
ncbi:MAG: hypothetical protein H6747_14245 [Deltaproteobacteria bacterium]|nr:hypothetical protein [Deltaproteobacteria bacterium]